MKTISNFCRVFLLLGFVPLCQAQQVIQQTASLPSPTPPTIISRDANSRVWGWTEYERGPNGQVNPIKHHYTELANGLCYQQNGQWMDSQEQINILPDGSAAATNGQHQAYFPANIYNGVITLITPDGLQLQSQPVGLTYDDGTNIVLIAELTNSVGQVISSNQVIYTNAFVGIDGDLLYTYRKSGFEQDVIFRQQPPAPEQFGLSSDSTRLQILTQFFNPPQPVETASPISPQDGLQDTTLTFGSMQMTHGRAFLIGTNSLPNGGIHQIPVYKSWAVVDGRSLLIEEVPYQRIIAKLSTLPMPATTVNAVTSVNSLMDKVSSKRLLPPKRLIKLISKPMKLAKRDFVMKPGFILDYAIINSAGTNYTFQGDTTYFISGDAYLYGTTILEGGTVIKCNNNGYIEIDQNGIVDCETTPYHPAVFTSWNDNSLGDTISGSSGSPNFQDVGGFFNYDPTNVLNLQYLRFCYAVQGVFQLTGLVNLWNCQACNVEVPVFAYDVGLYNDLFGYSTNEVSSILAQGNAQVFVEGPNLVAENVTADSGTAFIEADYYEATLNLTNCLITSEPIGLGDSWDPVLSANQVVNLLSPTNSVYQTVGAGSYYLTNDSPYRNYGTTSIDAGLLAELRQKTTYPPETFFDTTISTNLTLSPYAQRDTNIGAVDLGYHYDPLDYLVSDCNVTSNLTVAAGTAIGWIPGLGAVDFTPYGCLLTNWASLVFNGNVSQPCIFAIYSTVQENSNTNWISNVAPYYEAGIVLDGSTNATLPKLTETFTKSFIFSDDNFIFDNPGRGVGFLLNSEFYTGATQVGLSSLYFTNCLFFRNFIWFGEALTPTPSNSPSFNIENSTFYQGLLDMWRVPGEIPSFWFVENTSFDRTWFVTTDNFNGTNYTKFDYNAYNTNAMPETNAFWWFWNSPGEAYTLEDVGPHDLFVTNFNWETSWFGNFYLPTNSPLIEAGSTTADQVGLYEFTTQTNQTPETTNIVDIGYHYVATDLYGNPLDTYLTGIPNYIVDVGGNGVDTNGLPYWYECPYFGQTGVNPNAIDPDGFTTYDNYLLNISPIVDQSGQSGSRSNYSYTPADWLNGISGARIGSIGLDNEGNVTSVSQ